MVTKQLTMMVKEQKGRITELTKAKQEQSSQYRERVNVLEAHVEEARKRIVQFELMKQKKLNALLTMLSDHPQHSTQL